MIKRRGGGQGLQKTDAGWYVERGLIINETYLKSAHINVCTQIKKCGQDGIIN